MTNQAKLAALAVALAMGLCLARPGQAQDVTLVMPTNVVGIPHLNPILSANTNTATALIYDTLVVRDAQLRYHPALAQSWEGAEDGMSWTFHLKKDVKFHDGTPFTAETVKWFVEQYRGTENDYMINAVDHTDVIDPLTAKLAMKRPDPNLLFNFSTAFMGIPSPDAYKKLGKDYGVKGAVGTGPLMFKDFKVGQETVLERNPDYKWAPDTAKNRGPVKFKTLTIREIPDQATAFLELKTGGVDGLLTVPTDFLGDIKAQKTLGVISKAGLDVWYMPINVTKKPFDDIKVRQATALAINQKTILDDIFHGIGAEAHTFLIGSLPESKVGAQYAIGYDLAKAKAILDEDGWKPGADGIRVKDGQPLQTTLWTQNESEFRRVTEVVQAQLAAIGMKADITSMESSAIRAAYKKNEHMLAVRSYSWSNADIIDWFFSGKRLGYPNISMLNDPKAEALNEVAMKQSKTPDERTANFIKYHEYVLSQFPFAPIYQPVQNIAYNKERITFPADIDAPSATSTVLLATEMEVK